MGLTGERKEGNRVRESHLHFYKNDINSKQGIFFQKVFGDKICKHVEHKLGPTPQKTKIFEKKFKKYNLRCLFHCNFFKY
jgi:hypothetical protein